MKLVASAVTHTTAGAFKSCQQNNAFYLSEFPFGKATDCFQVAWHLTSPSQEGQSSAVVTLLLSVQAQGAALTVKAVSQADGSIFMPACLMSSL